MIKALIFDIGGVVTKADFNALYINFAHRSGLDPQAVVNFHNEKFKPMLLGEITFEKFLNALDIKGEKRIEELKEVWIEEALKVRTLDNDLIHLIDRLRKNLLVVALTNLTESRLFVDERTDLYSHFDNVFLSCKEHLMKPDEKFYRLALKKIAVQPEEAVFIDDKEQLVKVAEKIGIHGIVFQNARQLKTKLSRLGVI
jgi:putative hydrolase of the HAD superfamily